MRISTKGRGIIKAQQGTVVRPNPKENYKLPEDQRYQAQTKGMKDFAIGWYKERAKQPKYQSQVNESNLANNQLVKEDDIQSSTFPYDFNVHVSITNSTLTSKSYDFVADIYIDGVLDGFITVPASGTLDYQGATFFDRSFHFDLPTDLTNVTKLIFTGYFSTYRVTVDADSVTNSKNCQSGVATEISINQAYIGGDAANISINVII